MSQSNNQTQEPMLKFNGSGYGVKWATVLQFAVLVIGGIIAFTMAQAKLDSLSEQVLSNQQSVSQSLAQLSSVIETARIERNADFKDLERRVTGNEQERARVAQQVDSLERLLEDVRDLLRKQENRG